MRKKPKGRKYRNLIARGGAIYYERRWFQDGKTIRRVFRSLEVDDWDEAAATRDSLESKMGVSKLPPKTCHTFAEAAAEVLKGLGHLAPTTQDDRRAMLAVEEAEDGKVIKPAGPLVKHFGPMRLDAIRKTHLLDWWESFIVNSGGKRCTNTGKRYMDALADVFGWALDRELLDESPLEGLRAVLRRRGRTQRGRAEGQAGAEVNPIGEPHEVDALVAEAKRVGGRSYLVTLLLLDAGLRLGEATALDWEDVDLERRNLHVRSSRSRGRHIGETKSGRARDVAMSLRLRGVLREAWIREGRPDSGFVAPVDHKNYRDGKTGTGNRRRLRETSFQAMCRAAGLRGSHSPKSLRDTYASQLLTAGVQLGYISRQLGHSNVAITARHYARWCGDGAYRRPMDLRDGEVPADLLARLVVEESQQTPISDTAG